jgi:hypothetical protein
MTRLIPLSTSSSKDAPADRHPPDRQENDIEKDPLKEDERQTALRPIPAMPSQRPLTPSFPRLPPRRGAAGDTRQ